MIQEKDTEYHTSVVVLGLAKYTGHSNWSDPFYGLLQSLMGGLRNFGQPASQPYYFLEEALEKSRTPSSLRPERMEMLTARLAAIHI